jgi:ribose 5-phosphate isomerase B
MITIPIAADHAGYELKQVLIKYLMDKGYHIEDLGTHSTQSMDYPDVIHPLADEISNKEYELGIIICGTGNGVSMTANHHDGIRCALCWKKEIAEMARLHNDANILALPARHLTNEEAIEIVEVFLHTEFEGGRHQSRVDKIELL